MVQENPIATNPSQSTTQHAPLRNILNMAQPYMVYTTSAMIQKNPAFLLGTQQVFSCDLKGEVH